MNNQKLDEVRRTLQHLHHIASEPIDDIDPNEHDSADTMNPKFGRDRIISDFFVSAKRVFENGTAAIIGLARQHILAIGIGAVIAIGVAAGFGGWALVGTDGESVSEVDTVTTSVITPPEQHASDTKPTMELAISEVQQLISAGKIREARRRLINLDDKSPETALTLARSYDPNYLRLIPDADAAADPKEAERWYRAWRDIAAEKGLVMEADRLERIIKAMY